MSEEFEDYEEEYSSLEYELDRVPIDAQFLAVEKDLETAALAIDRAILMFPRLVNAANADALTKQQAERFPELVKWAQELVQGMLGGLLCREDAINVSKEFLCCVGADVRRR